MNQLSGVVMFLFAHIFLIRFAHSVFRTVTFNNDLPFYGSFLAGVPDGHYSFASVDAITALCAQVFSFCLIDVNLMSRLTASPS